MIKNVSKKDLVSKRIGILYRPKKEIYDKLKIQSEKTEMSMNKIINEIVKEWLRNE